MPEDRTNQTELEQALFKEFESMEGIPIPTLPATKGRNESYDRDDAHFLHGLKHIISIAVATKRETILRVHYIYGKPYLSTYQRR